MKPETPVAIASWKQLFTEIILFRGAQYATKGLVHDTNKGDSLVSATVSGSADYHVGISLVNGSITEMVCDCPYATDGQKACKHMAALLFSSFAPEEAASFRQKQSPKPKAEPAKVMRVTVRLEDIDAEAERFCSIPGIKIGDYVRIELREIDCIGMVTAIEPTDLPNLPLRGNQVLEIVEKPTPETPFTIHIVQPDRIVSLMLNLNGRIVERSLPQKTCEELNLKPGYILITDDREAQQAVIVKMAPTQNEEIPVCHYVAVKRHSELVELMSSGITVRKGQDSSGDDVSECILEKCTSEQENVTIPAGITRIAKFAFEDNYDVQRIIITAPRLTVDAFAFAHNESITDIELRNDMILCDVASFDGCIGLNRLVLPYSCFYMQDKLQKKYPNLKITFTLNDNINENGIIYSADLSRIVCCTVQNLAIYHCPLSVTSIGRYAFYHCSELRSLILTPYVKNIAGACLEGCFALERIEAPFDHEVSYILLFGNEYDARAKLEVLTTNEGKDVDFYIPPHCTFVQLPSAEKALHEINIDNVATPDLISLARHFINAHNMEAAISCYSHAAKEGSDVAYQKLIAFAQNETYLSFFSLDIYDSAMRTHSYQPFLRMLSLANPEPYDGIPTDEELQHSLSDTAFLKRFLQRIYDTDILCNDLLGQALQRLYPKFGRHADMETKRLFYLCARKYSETDGRISWQESLLQELFTYHDNQKLLLFDVLKAHYFEPDDNALGYIQEIKDNELQARIMHTYEASLTPGNTCVDLFKSYVEQAKVTGDELPQHCALLAISSLCSKCYVSKSTDQLRSILQYTLDACRTDLPILGKLILQYRQYMKRNIPRSYYRIIAQKLYLHGWLTSDYDTLLGDYRASRLAFYYRYAEYFDIDKPDNVMMRHIRTEYVCVPGIAIKDGPKASNDFPFKTFIPTLMGERFVVFGNSHEAVMYAQQNHLPVADYYFNIPLQRVYEIMETMSLSEVVYMPYYLGKTMCKETIERLILHPSEL